MYSRCTHCLNLLSISTAQLRSSRGLVKCSQCGKHFDALLTLSDQADKEFSRKPSRDFLRTPSEKGSHTGLYLLGSLLSLLILFKQVFYFEGSFLNRQPQLHAGLLEIGNRLNLKTPAYDNLDEWSVSHSDMQPATDSSYIFSAAITNQARFSQAYPTIKLVLLNFNGQAVAERVFSWWQFSQEKELAANETTEIRMTVVAPPGTAKIGGYAFTLL